MSYGLNIEMHKQVQIRICLPLCLRVCFTSSLSFSLFFLFLSHGWVLMYLVCALVDVSLCAHSNVFGCVYVHVCVCFESVFVCVYFVIDGALSPFPQLGLATKAQRQDEWLCRLIGAV